MAQPAVEEQYRRHRRAVHAMLARRHPAIRADERSDLYNEAWASVLSQRARGRAIEALEAYLVGAADKLAAKRLHGADARRRTSFDPLGGPLLGLADPSPTPEERIVEQDEERRLRMLVAELGGRERAVLELRIESGLEPAEIRARLGLSERQYRRVAGRAGRALLDALAGLEGGGWARRCRSLLCACAFGVASARQRERARELVASDPFCRALMRELRELGGRAAALVPLVPAAQSGRPGRVAELLGVARQHVLGLSSRALEATPLAGARPGAAAAVLAGCIAAGGGAICAVEVLPERPGEKPGAERREEPRERAEEPAPPPAPRPVPAVPEPARETPAPVAAPVATPGAPSEFEPAAEPPAPVPPAAPRASPEFSP